jgi:uncharacterized protein (DUF433 family)
MLDRIKIDPGVCEGKPTIRGMRITVDFVLKLLGDGYTADDIVLEYPELRMCIRLPGTEPGRPARSPVIK